MLTEEAMFVAVYWWRVHPGKEEQFRRSFIRVNAPSANDIAVGQGDASFPQATEPVPLLQFIT
jgi:hypothetical protein